MIKYYMNKQAEIISEINKNIVLIRLYVEPATCSSYSSSGDDYNECEMPPVYLEVNKSQLTDKIIDASELKIPGYEERIKECEHRLEVYDEKILERVSLSEKMRQENNILIKQKEELDLYMKDHQLYRTLINFEENKYQCVVIPRNYEITPIVEKISSDTIYNYKLLPSIQLDTNRSKVVYEIIHDRVNNYDETPLVICATDEEVKTACTNALLYSFKQYLKQNSNYSLDKIKDVISFIKEMQIENGELDALVEGAKNNYVNHEIAYNKARLKEIENKLSNTNKLNLFGEE